MPKTPARSRIDWMPGPAARQALQIAERLFPYLGRQAAIDKLVICGLHALRQAPLSLWGADRDAWELPAGLELPSPIPGKSATATREHDPGFPGTLREAGDRRHAAQRNDRKEP